MGELTDRADAAQHPRSASGLRAWLEGARLAFGRARGARPGMRGDVAAGAPPRDEPRYEPRALDMLPRGGTGIVAAVVDRVPGDMVARRLKELGFVPGERVEMIAFGPIGADPLAIRLGAARFALRRDEARRVTLAAEGRGPVPPVDARA